MTAAARRTEPAQLPILSDLHRALSKIERHFDAKRLNLIVNDPAVYPWVRGYAKGPLDLSDVAANRDNIVLVGEQGALVFQMLQPGLYEVHSQCLEAGRGRWMLRFVRACLHYMFTRTTAVELLTKTPKGNLAALTLARTIKGAFEFTAKGAWIIDRHPVDCDIYGLTLQSWARTAPGLVERGQWFHARLDAEYKRRGHVDPPHDDDDDHDRFAGLCCEMFLGGQVDKGLLFYHRAAAMAGYGPITITSREPLTLDIGTALIIVRDNDFWVPVVRPTAA